MLSFPITQFANATWTPWTPALTNTVAWYDPSDASTITDTGGLVDQLDDKSGNANHVTATLLQRPITATSTINGLNVLEYDGTSLLEQSVFNLPASGNHSVFAVCTVNSVTSTFDSLWSCDAASLDYQFSSNSVLQFDGRLTIGGLPHVIMTGGPFVGPSIFNTNFNFTDTFVNVYVDGTSKTINSAYGTKLTTPVSFRICANRAGSVGIGSNFGECIVIEDVSDNMREIIEGYLAHKWGIASNLPAAHPYKNKPP